MTSAPLISSPLLVSGPKQEEEMRLMEQKSYGTFFLYTVLMEELQIKLIKIFEKIVN